MGDALEVVATFIKKNKDAWVNEYFQRRKREHAFSDDLQKKYQEEIEKLLDLIILHFSGEQAGAADKVEEWAERLGEKTVGDGASLDQALLSLRIFHEVIWNGMEQLGEDADLKAKDVFRIARTLDPLLDRIINRFSLAHLANHKKTLESAKKAIQELSVPIVPLSEDVAVLPIIGEIDTDRARFIMESALNRSTELQLNDLIIDLSGVFVIDTMVAHNLFQVIEALKLIGVHVSLTGIRPEMAQTVVHLGIDFRRIPSYATLKQALEGIGFRHEQKPPLTES